MLLMAPGPEFFLSCDRQKTTALFSSELRDIHGDAAAAAAAAAVLAPCFGTAAAEAAVLAPFLGVDTAAVLASGSDVFKTGFARCLEIRVQ